MPRPRTIDDDTLKTLEQRLEKVQRQLRQARAAQKDQTRRDDARRKIIAGALALEHFEKNPGSEFGTIMFRLIDEYARADDRRLFEFLPVREDPKATDTDEADKAA